MSAKIPSVAELPAVNARQRIIEAACLTVVRDGYANLTLDAVAREAGVSKGGLLYHFPSKRALLEGMIQQRCERFEIEVRQHLQHDIGPGKWMRSIIRASCSPKAMRLQEGAAIFAVLANDSELLELVRQRRSRIEKEVADDGLDPVQMALVGLAVDGLCFNELLGVGGPQGEMREKVIERLLLLTSPDKQKKLKSK